MVGKVHQEYLEFTNKELRYYIASMNAKALTSTYDITIPELVAKFGEKYAKLIGAPYPEACKKLEWFATCMLSGPVGTHQHFPLPSDDLGMMKTLIIEKTGEQAARVTISLEPSVV